MEMDDLAAHALVVGAAYDFVRPLWRDHDLRAAWPAVDPLLRTCWAQHWAEPIRAEIHTYGFRPNDVVAAFTEEDPDHPLWAPFERAQLRMTEGSPLHTWGATGNHRLIAPDIELVYLTPHQGPIPPGGQFVGAPFLMRYAGDTWRVLNCFSERLPEPGWPPRLT